jgi:uncharacterized protein DUF3160
MAPRRRRPWAGIALFLMCSSFHATATTQETLPDEQPAPTAPWREQASKLGLGEKAIQQLARDRVLMTGERFKRVFTPYVDSSYPPFITSDSLINTFHLLFEESFLQLETIQAARLKHLLSALADQLATVDANLVGDQGMIRAAKLRATILVAVARTLLGDEPEGLPVGTAAIVRAEAERVTAARETIKPAWLGKPDPGFPAIDYGRFTVRGIYTRTSSLQRYFRAVSWLQAIPLRVHSDEELLTALMLGSAFGRLGWVEKQEDEDRLRALLEVYSEIIGTGDDWDLDRAEGLASTWANCELEFQVGPDSIAEVRRRALEYTGMGALINDQIQWPIPKKSAADQVGYRVLAAHRTPGSLLFRRTTDQRDPLLHGRTLPTGLEIGSLLGSDVARNALADFPRVRAVIHEMESLLEGESLLAEYLRCLQALVDAPEPDAPAFMASEPWRVKQLNTVLAGWAQMRHTFVLQAKQSFIVLCCESLPVGLVEPEPEFYCRFGRLVARTRELLNKAGAIGVFASDTPDPETPETGDLRIDHGMAWDRLHDLCLRLEILAHKQLRGVPFNEAERRFILSYGQQFHFSNSYQIPRDDAPRIADVHADPTGRQVLLVGIARPRALWVLYPWRGRDVLCRGAVMPYRELANPTRITDHEWMQRLDSREPPAAPTWIAPLVVRESLKK